MSPYMLSSGGHEGMWSWACGEVGHEARMVS
jgi:hypothetical protein